MININNTDNKKSTDDKECEDVSTDDKECDDVSTDDEEYEETDCSETFDDIVNEIPNNVSYINKLKLNNTWYLWYHHHKNNWKIDGYKKIFKIDTIESFWDLYENFNLIGGIHNKQFFLMRENINPIWEDVHNKKGGSWSFKIPTFKAYDLWKELSIYIIGEMLVNDSMDINGLSISTKNEHITVIKIWNKNKSKNNISLLPKSILNRFANNIMYKEHSPEY